MSKTGNTNTDNMIAATAKCHGLAVATRNTKHFESTGIPCINPWIDCRPSCSFTPPAELVIPTCQSTSSPALNTGFGHSPGYAHNAKSSESAGDGRTTESAAKSHHPSMPTPPPYGAANGLSASANQTRAPSPTSEYR